MCVLVFVQSRTCLRIVTFLREIENIFSLLFAPRKHHCACPDRFKGHPSTAVPPNLGNARVIERLNKMASKKRP